MTLDFSQDYLIWDNPEAVTLVSVATAGDVELDVATALRLPVRAREPQPSYGVYTASDALWILPETLLGGVTPKLRDRIRDESGVEVMILDYAYSRLTRSFNCTTRDMRIAADLRDLVDIETPTVGRGVTGARSNTAWTAAYSQIPARVQPERQELSTDRGKKAPDTRYTVYLDRQVTPTNAAGDFGRVKWGSLYLEVTAYRDAERITDLPALECVRLP